MRGVRPLLESVWLIRERINPELQLLGVLPTMHYPNSSHAAAVVEEMNSVFKTKMINTVIPLDEVAPDDIVDQVTEYFGPEGPESANLVRQ